MNSTSINLSYYNLKHEISFRYEYFVTIYYNSTLCVTIFKYFILIVNICYYLIKN